MTTIGISTYQHDNPKEMCMPSYAYQFPATRRVQLASIKEGIFHPRLPSIRNLDRDHVLHKLPDEHCRTSQIVEENGGDTFGESSYSSGLIQLVLPCGSILIATI